ncbi:phosphoesterase [Diaporthe sp. PMI_573]|nr:phosphoesterase [Diaporthaceae sp. PMI_573]
MTSQARPLSSIKLPGQRKRCVAQRLLKLYSACVHTAAQPSHEDTVRVVCVSDTHNTRPQLPFGDVLIHAGDLTENGSFDEIQTELSWLSSQAHRYKVFVAGNHDVLLDGEFLEKHPERRYGSSQSKEDLDWGSVIYLQNSSTTLDFPRNPDNASVFETTSTAERTVSSARRLITYGSPFTPQYGTSAFQYSPDPHFWAEIFAPLVRMKPDILVTHGPPKFHLDARDFHRAGCPYLSGEVARIRPKLHVFGHIHTSYGREDAVLDGMQRAYEDVMIGWAAGGQRLSHK